MTKDPQILIDALETIKQKLAGIGDYVTEDIRSISTDALASYAESAEEQKQKVSRFEYAIMQGADPEHAKNFEPYTEEEEMDARVSNLRVQASKLRIQAGSADNWQPIETAPKDGTTVEISYDKEHTDTCLAMWSQRPVCMLGNRNGGYPPGWATAPESDCDTNLPLDAPFYWRPYTGSTEGEKEKESESEEVLRDPNAEYTYFQIDFEDCALGFDFMVVDSLEDVSYAIPLVEIDLDDPERKAVVKIKGVPMTPLQFQEWEKKNWEGYDEASGKEPEKKDPWISVNERLPEKGQIVLAYIPACPYTDFVECFELVTLIDKEGRRSGIYTYWFPLPKSPAAANQEIDKDGQ